MTDATRNIENESEGTPLMNLTKLVLAAIVAISAILAVSERNKSDEKNLYFYLQDFPEILELIDKAYVQEVDWNTLMPGAFQGILETVDPNASYIPPDQVSDRTDPPIIEGFGFTPAKRQSYAYVLNVLPGSAAEQAGLRSGDYIRQIAGHSTRRLSLHAIRRLLYQATDPIDLLVTSEVDFEDRHLVIAPRSTPIPKLTADAHSDGLIELTLPAYYPDLEKDLRHALTPPNAHPQGILLDLRENATTDEALLRILARCFLPKGELAQTSQQLEHPVPLLNPKTGAWVAMPLCILVDRSTSAMAELFSAIVQDQGAGQLLGEPTLGYPFLVQRITLKNGAQIELPTTRIRLSSGKPFPDSGLTPDVEIPRPTELRPDDPMRAQALEILRRLVEKSAQRKAA